MRLAACLIVKNVALVIQRCLDSLRGLVQAVFVVDTASTDNTVAANRGMHFPVAIHLHQRPWKNFGHEPNSSNRRGRWPIISSFRRGL